jgi:hypothetical protein
MFGDIETTFGNFWDAGAQELTADVNNTSVSTGSATITNQATAGSLDLSDLALDTLYDFETNIQDTNSGTSRAAKITTGVGTSATSIFERSGGSENLNAHTVFVYGVDDSDGTVEFTDFLLWHSAGETTVINSTARGTPSGRTYSDDTTDLNLAMGADSYNVIAVGTGAQTE